MDTDSDGLLLGKNTPLVESYDPGLLFPVPRSQGRAALGIDAMALPFRGEDLWHAWELSFEVGRGKPVARVGRFRVPAHSPNLIESKSFKLYLNSLNFQCFENEAHAAAQITADLSQVAGAEVTLELLPVDDKRLQAAALSGRCIDELDCEGDDAEPEPSANEQPSANEEPSANMLVPADKGLLDRHAYHSHLLRSLCPVTAQPDWGSVQIVMGGAAVAPESLLRYLLAFRRHQEFHEQCVERIYMDLERALGPSYLEVHALYTRRGGLDINPWRCSEAGSAPGIRLHRQ